MLMWIIQIILIILIMKFIEEIGIWGSCILFGVLHVIGALFGTITFGGLIMAFITGVVYGFFAFLIAKVLLIVIDVLGSVGAALIGLIVILAILAIIF